MVHEMFDIKRPPPESHQTLCHHLPFWCCSYSMTSPRWKMSHLFRPRRFDLTTSDWLTIVSSDLGTPYVCSLCENRVSMTDASMVEQSITSVIDAQSGIRDRNRYQSCDCNFTSSWKPRVNCF